MDSNANSSRNLGIYLTLFVIALIFLLFYLWPVKVEKIEEPNTPVSQSLITGTDANIVSSAQKDKLEIQCPVTGVRFIELVLIIGALGACLHAITSLAFHCSRKDFSENWFWWYIYRPFVGGILALIFYLIINGGFMSPVSGDSAKFFVLLGISGLIGLFSNQALDRLGRIFDAIFASVKAENTNDNKNSKDKDKQAGKQPADASEKNRPEKNPPKNG